MGPLHRRRRRALAGLGFALVLALLLWRGPRSYAPTRPPPRAGDAAGEARARDDSASARARRAAANGAPALTLDPRGDPTQPAPGPSLPAGAFPYPPGSQPLTEGVDPATTTPEDDPVDADSGVHVVFGPRRDVVHPPDPMIIDLAVLDRKGQRLAISDGVARFRDERATAASGTGASAPFVDDGSGADRAAGDLRYTATFAPSPADQARLLRFRVFVEVAFSAPRGLGARRYSTWLEYTPQPGAELSGRYDEGVQDGSLVVSAGITVRERGQYKLIASLYAADRQTAIAFAQNSLQLDPGDRSIPLTFFGKILHDRALDGPYLLRYLMLFQELPADGIYRPGVTVDDAYTTRAYRAADFSPASYTPPPATGPVVTADSPSQQDKPPPLFSREEYARQHGLPSLPSGGGAGAASLATTMAPGGGVTGGAR